MIRALLWVIAGVLLGLVIHLIIILILPRFATDNVWTQMQKLEALGQVVVIPQPGPGAPNPFGLDPEMVYAVCQFDLENGPGAFSGELPADFWSVGIFDRDGVSVYSTTNRSGVGQSLELGLFNVEQTGLLSQQQYEIDEGLLIVTAPQNDVFAVVRLALPFPELRARYEEALTELSCDPTNVMDAISDK